MKYKTIFRQVLFIILCFTVNYFGKLLADSLSFPVWLDAIGTVFGAYILGPVCGAIIGAASNIIYSFNSPDALYHLLTNILIGIVVGISAKKGFLKDMFGILSTAFVVTLVSVAISTPLNFLVSDGTTGNIWGDGIIELFQEFGMNRVLSCIMGEYYLDFLDKTLSLLLLSGFINLKKRKHIRHFSNLKMDNKL